MSFTPYLSSIAEALMKRVHPHVEDARARDALEACVRSIASLSTALDDSAVDHLAALQLPAGVQAKGTLLVKDPPENIAANNDSAARIAAGEAWLFTSGWVNDAALTQQAKAMLAWERQDGQAKVARMFAIEDQSTAPDGDLAKLTIDRAKLESYLQARYGAAAKIAAFRQTVGGRSRQTAVFTLEGTDLPQKLVVQRDHPASITRDGIIQQFPVVSLLAETKLKVSKPLLLETEREILGAPFMILAAAEGSVAGMDYFRPPQSPELALELAEQLAILHAADPSSLVGSLRSTTDPANPRGWAEELDAIEAAWRKFAHAPSLTFAAALSWMRAHVDQIGNETAIIHNDAAFHNILVADGRFSSLLDFELVHLGHPAEDLGYCRPFVQEMTEWDKFIDAYVAAGGKRFPADVVDYFSLRGGVHLMTLLQYGRGVFKSGATTDINLAEAAMSFIPKQHNRIARMVEVVLDRAAG
jgi:aminoglycoside phosphotransferase (APT) family kinase protein